MTLRINEAYGHEPILPYGMDETTNCHTGGCDKTGVQCVDISAPITLKPSTTVGTAVVTCQGNPSITCSADASGSYCNVVLTQRVCVSIPVRYSVEVTTGESVIECAGNDSADGSCSCCG